MKNEQVDLKRDVSGVSGFALTGKVAVVTGSGRGLGRAMAEGLAAAGAAVVTCARSFDEAMEVAARISDAGGRAIGVAVDVTDRRSCAELIERTVAAFGRVDVLVNNAGSRSSSLRTRAVTRACSECGAPIWWVV